jgi:hypothetical protein
MKAEIVRYTLETLPRPTAEDIERMKRLAERPDSEIDTSDIPVLTEEQWKNAPRRTFPRSVNS